MGRDVTGLCGGDVVGDECFVHGFEACVAVECECAHTFRYLSLLLQSSRLILPRALNVVAVWCTWFVGLGGFDDMSTCEDVLVWHTRIQARVVG